MSVRRRRLIARLAFFVPLLAANIGLAASIGVLSDGRQIAELSPLSSGSAVRVALEADGHTLLELGPGSLQSISVMQTVDIIWLPLLDPAETYTSQERTNVVLYVAVHGGGIIWQGDADVYNDSDDSFLSAFSLSKLAGNYGSELSPTLADHPIVTGPYGTVGTIGSSASYGLFTSSEDVADVFVNGTGTVIGCIDATTGFEGNGRVALICDTTMFSQLLLQDDHKPLLRNIVKWVEATSGYTPSGTNVETGDLGESGDIITQTHVTIAEVLASGETTITDAGTGRCFFDDVDSAEVPADFLGTAVAVTTTATLPTPVAVTVSFTYDAAAMTDLGITDEASLRAYRFDPDAQTLSLLSSTIDADNNTIDAEAVGLGTFLVGALIAADDCNSNGTPDACEILNTSPADGGPFYCSIDCDPDCNDNGIPDECDIADGTSEDCNENIVPDECETDVDLTVSSTDTETGTTTPNGTSTYTLCEYVDIVATPAAGYCFEHWIVNQGDEPVDPNATETSIRVEMNKSVAASFVKLIQEEPVAVIACEDEPASFSVVVHEDFEANASFQWKHGDVDLVDDDVVSGATTATLTIDPVSLDYAGSYTCVVTHDCGEATTEVAGLTVRLSPEIVAQPIEKDACPGSNVTFSVEATGASLTYKWQFNDGSGSFVNLVEATGEVVGAQTRTLTLMNVDADDAGHYRCVVTGMCDPFVTTDEVELNILELVSLAEEPEDAFACPGEERTFQLSASGSGASYQWEFDDGTGFSPLSDSDRINGVTTNTLTISEIEAGDDGEYRCTISGTCGYAVTTEPVTLNVGAFLDIVDQPEDDFICPGNDAQFSLLVGGSDRTYQWQFDDGSGFVDLDDTMTDVDGATTTGLTILNASAEWEGEYRCVISCSCGDDAISDSAVLTIGEEPSITTQPSNVDRCPGADATFSIEASGSYLTYSWEFGEDDFFETLIDGNGISGATTPTLTIEAVDESRDGEYRCLIYGTCGPTAIGEPARLDVSLGHCDCNSNGVIDTDDIAYGTSLDCNDNGLPDECDLVEGTVEDCNTNGVPDECDIANGTSIDCNSNGVPDDCDLSEGAAEDCNANDIPDLCDIADGTSIDCNQNNVPDECDPPYFADAGEDLYVCLETASAELGGDVVASGSTPPYTYAWEIISGPDGGAAILDSTVERARLYATMTGEYEVRLTVSDDTSPPCVVTDTVIVTARGFEADAGDDIYMCADGTSDPFTPLITDGVAPFSYEWSLLTGSADTSLDQFTGTGYQSEGPTFTPSASGTYLLQMSVTDSGDPPCTATDTLTIHTKVVEVDAGPSFAMCTGLESQPLDAVVTAGGTEPLSYEWSIEYGPNTASSQFTGDGPFALQPTFEPLEPGQYTLRLTVTDSGTPACVATDIVTITAVTMSVDAGIEQASCVGANGIRMSPTVTGGYGGLTYIWSIEEGSPDTDTGQFTDPHHFGETPLFIPSEVGEYRLKLTVIDSATPPCQASDSVVVQATTLTVDAGQDFSTLAFQASQNLGAVPVVGGGNAPYYYEWQIIGGPDRNAAQLSNQFAEHPTFRPSQPGVYEITVTVDDGNGCAISDTVVVQAVSSSLELPVNSLGRLFMDLQIDAAHTRGQIRMTQGTPGTIYRGEIRDDGDSANYNGMLTSPAISRRLFLSCAEERSSYVAVIALHYDVAELGGTNERNLRVYWYSQPQDWWQSLGTGTLEISSYPYSPKASDVGRHGIDTVNHCAWVVVDRLGEFAIGISNGQSPPSGADTGTGTGTGDDGNGAQPGDSTIPAGFCGAAGPATMLSLAPLLMLCRGVIAPRRRRMRR